jgi:hypothetical protein
MKLRKIGIDLAKMYFKYVILPITGAVKWLN